LIAMDVFTASFNNLKKRTSQLKTQITSGNLFQGEVGEQRREHEAEISIAPTIDGSVLVRYAVQNMADADREGSVFMLPAEVSSGGITVALVRAYFPMPGQFHFRFKAPSVDGAFGGFIWLDVNGEGDVVPMFNGGIFMKALQMPDNGRAPARPKFTVSAPEHPLYPAPSYESSAPIGSAPSGLPEALDQSFQYEAPRPVAPSQPAQPASPGPAQQPHAQSAPQAAPAPKPPPSTPLMPDLMEGFDIPATPPPAAAAPAPAAPAPPPPKVQMPDREELVRKREDEKQQRIEQKMNDHIMRRKTEDDLRKAKVEASGNLRAELDKWARTPDGSGFKDIRTLLSTMHEVLWEGSGWKPVNLSELIQDGSIKKKYRMAIVLCHPDRHQEANADQQTRADRVFNALNEAYKVSS